MYELYLVKRFQLKDGGQVELVDKPAYEDREIVTTPQPLVNEVVRRALDRKLLARRTPRWPISATCAYSISQLARADSSCARWTDW